MRAAGAILTKDQAVGIRLAGTASQTSRGVRAAKQGIRALNEGARDTEGLCVIVKMFASEDIVEVYGHGVELRGRNRIMLAFGVEKSVSDASLFLHRAAIVDISYFNFVETMFPQTAGAPLALTGLRARPVT